MDDQRTGRGPSLDRENARNRAGIKRIGAESVDRLGGKGDQSPAANQLRRMLDFSGSRRHYSIVDVESGFPWWSGAEIAPPQLSHTANLPEQHDEERAGNEQGCDSCVPDHPQGGEEREPENGAIFKLVRPEDPGHPIDQAKLNDHAKSEQIHRRLRCGSVLSFLVDAQDTGGSPTG